MKKLTTKEILQDEIKGFRTMLEDIPEDDFISRISLSSRIESLEEELKNLPEEIPKAEPARVVVKFDGKPVIRQEGIASTFATKATGGFNKLVRAVYACLQDEDVAEAGRLPGKDMLMITGVVHGSFGFVMEEIESEELAEPNQLIMNNSYGSLQEAVDETLELIEEAKNSDSFISKLSDIGKRSHKPLTDFINTLSANNATLHLSSPTHEVDLNIDSVQAVKKNINDSEPTENETDPKLLVNRLYLLPQKREAEYWLPGDETVRNCRVSRSISKEDIDKAIEYVRRQSKKVSAVFRETTTKTPTKTSTKRTLIRFIFE